MVAGTGDQDVKANALLSDSSLYNGGRCSQVYTRLKYWLIMLEAFYQSAVVFFIPYAALYGGAIGLVEFGFIINTIVVIVASLHLAIETLHWTWIHHFFLWGSCLLLFVFNYVYCAINTQQRFMDTYFIMQVISTLPSFWFLLILTPMIALLPRSVLLFTVCEPLYFEQHWDILITKIFLISELTFISYWVSSRGVLISYYRGFTVCNVCYAIY